MNAIRARALGVLLVASGLVLSVPATVHPFTLRVLAASELRVEPRLMPDRTSLTLTVRLHDDRSAPLARRTVTLRVTSSGDVDQTVALSLGANGEATHTIPITRAQSRVRATAYYAGDGATASRQTEITVNLDAPYVTIDLMAPAGGVELGAGETPFVVTLHAGEVLTFPVEGHAVEVREGSRTVASGRTDVSGRATLPVDPVRALGTAGVHKLRAHVMVEGEHLEGPVHDVLVRAQTAVSLVRVGGDDAAAVDLRGTLLTMTGVPVPNAAVRVARGADTLAGARTDAQGRFQARLGVDILAEHGVAVRAVFEPTEPWYGASESAPVELTAPPPPRIHWLWVVAPAALAALGLGAVLARARLRGAAASPEAEPERGSTAAWDRVEHVAPSVTGGLRVRFVVVDRASTRPVLDPMARWGAEPEWRAVSAESVAVQAARRVEFEVGASGYAPRKVVGEFSRPGEYIVRVQLRTWREELFERARPWLRRAGAGASALPTLREALKKRAVTPEARAFVELIEAGCYAPDSPSAREVARAEELSPVMEPSPTLSRD